MGKFLVDRSGFFKTMTVLAIAFGVGLGMCGLSYALPSSDQEFHTNWLGGISLLVIVISVLGLIITLIVWIIAAVVGSSPGKPWGGQTLFGDPEEKSHDKDHED